MVKHSFTHVWTLKTFSIGERKRKSFETILVLEERSQKRRFWTYIFFPLVQKATHGLGFSWHGTDFEKSTWILSMMCIFLRGGNIWAIPPWVQVILLLLTKVQTNPLALASIGLGLSFPFIPYAYIFDPVKKCFGLKKEQVFTSN